MYDSIGSGEDIILHYFTSYNIKEGVEIEQRRT